MIKQFVAKPRQQGAGAAIGSDVGSAIWATVGRRLRRRRAELGYGADRIAHWAAISVETYESYEKGTPIPAALLAQIAELLEIPLVWFFQGVAQDDTTGNHAESEHNAGEEPGPVVFQVATVEHRIAALVEAFRQLDFEGQQHLLAISRELSRTNARTSRE